MQSSSETLFRPDFTPAHPFFATRNPKLVHYTAWCDFATLLSSLHGPVPESRSASLSVLRPSRERQSVEGCRVSGRSNIFCLLLRRLDPDNQYGYASVIAYLLHLQKTCVCIRTNQVLPGLRRSSRILVGMGRELAGALDDGYRWLDEKRCPAWEAGRLTSLETAGSLPSPKRAVIACHTSPYQLPELGCSPRVSATRLGNLAFRDEL